MKEVKINSKDNNENKQEAHIFIAVIIGLYFSQYTYELGASVGGMFGRLFF